MSAMWVSTSTPSLACPAALKLTPRVTRSLARFYGATAFNQDLSNWDVDAVTDADACVNFCADGAGFTSANQLPGFPGGSSPTCGPLGCFGLK